MPYASVCKRTAIQVGFFLGGGLLGACGSPSVQAVPGGGVPVTVTSASGLPYTYADGAQAKKQADAQCGTGGVQTSIYDRFEDATGAWVFPGGCA